MVVFVVFVVVVVRKAYRTPSWLWLRLEHSGSSAKKGGRFENVELEGPDHVSSSRQACLLVSSLWSLPLLLSPTRWKARACAGCMCVREKSTKVDWDGNKVCRGVGECLEATLFFCSSPHSLPSKLKRRPKASPQRSPPVPAPGAKSARCNSNGDNPKAEGMCRPIRRAGKTQMEGTRRRR